MKQEEKELLIKDLCGRLPYGVKYVRDSWNYEWDEEMSVVEVLGSVDREGYINNTKVYQVDDIKPYLRPKNSMTEEEKEEWVDLRTKVNDYVDDYHVVVDFYNKHHFDYRGLLEYELAIEAPEGMYEISYNTIGNERD